MFYNVCMCANCFFSVIKLMNMVSVGNNLILKDRSYDFAFPFLNITLKKEKLYTVKHFHLYKNYFSYKNSFSICAIQYLSICAIQ